MSWIANIIYTFAALGYLPVLGYQMIAQGKNRSGWREKLLGPRSTMASDGSGKRIWVHAVSLGEINAARLFVEKLQADSRLDVMVSTTTDTGFARACQLFGADRVFRYPLDFSWSVRNALRTIDPAMIVLVELEVWYNLTTIAQKRGIPVCVINGRLTERSRNRLALLGPLSRRMFKSLTWVGAQDATIAERFKSLGVPGDRVEVTGSVKWDTASIADHIEGQELLAAGMGIDVARPILVCGSTGPGEEAMLLDAHDKLLASHPDAQLVLVPRKPERFDEVAALIERRGYSCVRRSDRPDGATLSVPHPGRAGHPGANDQGPSKPVVFLGDTMGELRKFYALADVVFVGRSLVPMGGSDPMEVAALAKPIIVGPHMSNFSEAVSRLTAADAIVQVNSADELAEQLDNMQTDSERQIDMGKSAQDVVKANQGATQVTVDRIEALVV